MFIVYLKIGLCLKLRHISSESLDFKFNWIFQSGIFDSFSVCWQIGWVSDCEIFYIYFCFRVDWTLNENKCNENVSKDFLLS